MHKDTLNKAALALTFWLALYVSPYLRAQTFVAPLQASTTGTDPVDFEFRADGTLIGKGNYGVGSLLSGDQGAGTRLLWFPSLAAFRAGQVSGTDWDASNIGQSSAAFGGDTTASAGYSFATGNNSAASGWGSVSMGINNTSSGYGTLAMGSNNSSTSNSSMALGFGNTAGGLGAVALGGHNSAYGNSSVTLGNSNMVVSSNAVAMGYSNYVSGSCAVVAGLFNTNSAYASLVVGIYNVGGGNPNSFVATDPAFEIGNGTSSTPSDALVVYKNGSATFQGPVTVSAGGDIPMYSGD